MLIFSVYIDKKTKKISNVDKKIPNISGLVKKTDFKTKVSFI